MKTKQTKTVPSPVGNHPSLDHAIHVVARVWIQKTGRHPIVTGLAEEGHSDGSRHYGFHFVGSRGKVYADPRGYAVDFRDDLADAERDAVDAELELRLGRGEFDRVWEKKSDGSASHLHIEVDPKEVAS